MVGSDSTFSAEDFKWDSGLVNTPIDFSSDKISLTNGGKSIKVEQLTYYKGLFSTLISCSSVLAPHNCKYLPAL